MEVPRMRWLLASLFVSVLFQVSSCGSRSKPAEGVERGPCYPNLTCNAGLTCLSGLCVYAGPSTSTGVEVDTGVQTGTGGVDGGQGGGMAPSDSGVGGNTGAGGTGPGAATPGGGNAAATGGTINFIPDAGPDAFPDTASNVNGCPVDSVCFKNGSALGVMTGFGWVDLGKYDSLTSPTCGAEAISNSSPCQTTTTWSKTDALCMSGSIPALPASPMQADYDNNWGVQIGVYAGQDGDAIGLALVDYMTLTFTISGSPTSGLRAILHRKGDPALTTYCVDSIKSGRAIALAKFNTRCWGDAATVYLTEDDLPMIDKVGIQISSTAAPITIADLCLNQIAFGK